MQMNDRLLVSSIFAEFDTGDGQVRFSELARLLRALGDESVWSDADIAQIVRAVCRSAGVSYEGDGSIKLPLVKFLDWVFGAGDRLAACPPPGGKNVPLRPAVPQIDLAVGAPPLVADGKIACDADGQGEVATNSGSASSDQLDGNADGQSATVRPQIWSLLTAGEVSLQNLISQTLGDSAPQVAAFVSASRGPGERGASGVSVDVRIALAGGPYAPPLQT